MDTAAIIIARGGSIRLPRKNVKDFCGLPLVAWSIIQAEWSETIDRVYLSTDDDEIVEIGTTFGADIIRRPDWPDADLVAANRVYLHALQVLRERGELPDAFVCMFPTSPLRLPGDVDKGVRHFQTVGGPHVSPMAKNRETIIYKDIGGLIAKSVLWDKRYNYMQGNSGLYNVVSPSWYEWFTARLTEYVGDDDKALDAMAQPDNRFEHPDSDTYYTECEPWQCVETDTAPEFELGEVLMQHYILKGRHWDRVYFDGGNT